MDTLYVSKSMGRHRHTMMERVKDNMGKWKVGIMKYS